MHAPTPANDPGLAEIFAAALAAAVDAKLDALVAERLTGATPESAPAHLDGWLSVAEVAMLVGVSRRTVHRALRSGALIGHRAGGAGSRWHIRPDAVTAWLAPQPATAASAPPRPVPQASRTPAPRLSTPRRSFAERARSNTRR